MGLEEYRSEIEEIDEEIIRLIDRRIGISKKIFAAKKIEGKPISDPSEREPGLEQGDGPGHRIESGRRRDQKYIRDLDSHERAKTTRAAGKKSGLNWRKEDHGDRSWSISL